MDTNPLDASGSGWPGKEWAVGTALRAGPRGVDVAAEDTASPHPEGRGEILGRILVSHSPSLGFAGGTPKSLVPDISRKRRCRAPSYGSLEVRRGEGARLLPPPRVPNAGNPGNPGNPLTIRAPFVQVSHMWDNPQCGTAYHSEKWDALTIFLARLSRCRHRFLRHRPKIFSEDTLQKRPI